MKCKLILIAILLTLTLTTNIFASDFYSEDNRNIVVNEKNPVFSIKLKSNPTTGYSWFLRDYDASLIKPLQQSFERPDQTLMGAPGYEVWTFSVKPEAFIVPQQTTIKMIYARPWQMTGGTPIEFQVTIHGNSNSTSKNLIKKTE